MKSILKEETKVIIGNCRLSYAHLFEPYAFSEDQEPKFSVSLIISKDDKETIALIEEAIENAIKAGMAAGKWGGKRPKGLRLPLRDGDIDREEDEAYQNSYFINANTKKAPQVVGRQKDRATGKLIPIGEDEVYSGCYANVSVIFYPYDNISKGIGAGLNNVQKWADGEPLGANQARAEDEFDFEEIDSDDDFLA